uniref:Uncharacterized protein n=1 Tax=Arundo donax TaxID=35708 RepID=A0A0A9HBJ3_ARUDO
MRCTSISSYSWEAFKFCLQNRSYFSCLK